MLLDDPVNDDGANALYCAGPCFDGLLAGHDGRGDLSVAADVIPFENFLRLPNVRHQFVVSLIRLIFMHYVFLLLFFFRI